MSTATATLEDCAFIALSKTKLGLLVEYEGEQVWLPVSQIRLGGKDKLRRWRDLGEGELITLEVPMWLATDKGMV